MNRTTIANLELFGCQKFKDLPYVKGTARVNITIVLESYHNVYALRECMTDGFKIDHFFKLKMYMCVNKI